MLIEMERCEVLPFEEPSIDVFIVHRGEGSDLAAVRLARTLRSSGVSVAVGESARSLKSQMRTANAASAVYAAIIGEDELATGNVVLKDLRSDDPQRSIPAAAVSSEVRRVRA
jgi:histidyl-tRNA synthetase